MESSGKIVLSAKKIVLLATLGFAQGVIFLLPYMMGPYYKPMLETLQCTDAQLGFLMSVMGIVMMFTVLPGGWVADRFDTRKLVSASLALTGIIGISLAFFPSYGYYCFAWGCMAVISNLLYWSAGMKLARIIASPEEQGKAYGYSYAFNGVSTYLFGAMGVALLASAGAAIVTGFKYVVIFYGVMNLLSAVAVWVLFGNAKLTAGTVLSADEEQDKPSFKEMLKVLAMKETWLFSIVAFCLYSSQAVTTYFTPFFTDVLGLSEAVAGGIYMAVGPTATIAPIIMGTFADKIGSVIKTILMVMGVTIIFLSVLLVMNQSLPVWAAVFIDIVATALIGGSYSVQFSAFDEIKLDRKVAGSCIGMASIIAYSADIFIWTMFGSMLDNYGNDGYTMIFGCLFGLAVVSIVGCLFLGKLAKGKHTPQAGNLAA